MPQWPQFVLFPLIFVVHLSSVLRATSANGRLRWRDLVAGAPPVVCVAFGVLFVGVWLATLASVTRAGGQPTISGGRYYLDDHGSLIPVTKIAYAHALVLQQRIFTLVPSAFFALGVLVHYPRRLVSDNPGARGEWPPHVTVARTVAVRAIAVLGSASDRKQ